MHCRNADYCAAVLVSRNDLEELILHHGRELETHIRLGKLT